MVNASNEVTDIVIKFNLLELFGIIIVAITHSIIHQNGMRNSSEVILIGMNSLCFQLN